jgi:predicted metal-dependent phosphoesterase TrpH
MTASFADLHTHTTASDGTNAPAVNVRLAKQAGLGAIAITDHDTVAGLKEAIEEGARIGIDVVPGVEISTVANGQDIHVLGYYIDYENDSFLRRLEQLRNTRDRRNDLLIAKLQELGIAISMEEVLANMSKRKADEETVGRPHIAEALVRKGVVSSITEAFDVYLGRDGLAYVNPPRIEPMVAVDWIRQAGGAAVLAHPGLYGDDQLVVQLIQYGIDGIEAFHSDHTSEDEARYVDMAQRHQLIVTAGSDFHGERNGVMYHAPVGSKKVAVDILPQLRARRRTYDGRS